MKKVLASTVVALAGLLGPAAGALAASTAPLPTFKSHLIVPGKSLGGVRLLSTYTSAARALGTSSRHCSLKAGCAFEGKDMSSFSITFQVQKAHQTPFAGQIIIMAAKGFDTPLASLKTASGIGLGSTAAAVRRAYPHVKVSPSVDYLIASRDVQTVFAFTDGRVSEIGLQGVTLR